MSKHTFLIYAPDYTAEGTFERRMSVRSAHQAHMKELIVAGTLSYGGFMFSHDSLGVAEADRKLTGSTLVVHVESAEAARAILEEDPYWTSNVWDRERLTITPFQPVAGGPPASS